MATMSMTATLRRAIRDSGETPYRIAKDAGVDQSVLSKFIHGERDLKLSTVEKLAGYLGLELRPKRKAADGKKSGKAEKR